MIVIDTYTNYTYNAHDVTTKGLYSLANDWRESGG